MRTAWIPSPLHWPYHVPLLAGEALGSWIWRVAGRFEISARHLLQGAFGVGHIDKESVRGGTWWRTPEQSLLAAISARTGIAVARLAAGNAGELVAGFSGRPGGLGTSGPQVPGWRHGADLGGHCGVSTMPRREWHCLFAEELVLPMAELLSEARHHHDLRVWVLRYAAPYATIVVRAAVVAQRLPNMRMVNGWRRDGTSARSSASFAKATPGRQALRLDGAAGVGTPFVSGINAMAEVIWVHGKPACRLCLRSLPRTLVWTPLCLKSHRVRSGTDGRGTMRCL
jgi:hypothetical protein